MNPVFRSIRWQLQAWHGLILIAVLTGFGLTAYQVAWDNQLLRIDRELEQQLSRLTRPVPPELPSPRELPGRGLPPDRPRRDRGEPSQRHGQGFIRERLRELIGQNMLETGVTNVFYFILWHGDGTIAARSPSAPAVVPRPIMNSLEPGADAWRGSGPGRTGVRLISTRTRGDFREASRSLPFGDSILVGRSMGPDLSAMRRLAGWLGAAGTGILALGLAGGWWVATRAIRPVEAISATAVKIAAGDLSQRINAADTQSELGRLAGVLNSTFARLEAAFASQAQFTSDASHELRTPICVILSQTQTTLARERSAGEYREALQACQRSAQRMRKLTGALLELARLDAGEDRLVRESFDLAEVARECVELLRPLAAERALTLHSDLASAVCAGDAPRLAQVVTNLLTNAIHYNQSQGQVTLSTRMENHWAVLTVMNSGPGIAPEDLPHVFERFYRADKSRSSPEGRTGLGLAISKAIVDAHGGAIEARSVVGSGATFTVRLPAGGESDGGLARPVGVE